MCNVVKTAYDKGYRVTDDGILLGVNGLPKSARPCKRGYQNSTIKIGNACRRLYVHRLMAYQKYGEAMFDSGIHVRHLNGVSTDNRIENIAIGTASENTMDKPESVRQLVSSQANRVFSDEQVKRILKDRAEGATYKELKERYGAPKSTLSYLFNRSMYAAQAAMV